MKPIAVALLALLAACGGGGAPSRPPEGASDEMQFEMAIASQIAFDVTRLKNGEWALYSIRLVGKAQPDYVKFQVVDEDASSLWIENKVPALPRPFVLKSRFEKATGNLLEHWRGEAGSAMPAKLYPSEKKAPEAPTRRDPSVAKPQIKEDVDQVTVGGKTWTTARVTTTLAYPDGRKSVLTDWYHKDVPFAVVVGGKSYGGVVRRQFGRMTMELVDSGSTGARAELEIPK
jgi:hypothetical protein